MNEHNPYAAPQTTDISPVLLTPPREDLLLKDNLQQLAKGAFYCHDALKTVLSLFAGIFLYPFPSWFEFAAKYLMPCFIVIAHLLQLYGLSKLCQTSRESAARWLIITSLIIFVGSAVCLMLAYLTWGDLLGVMYMLASIPLYTISFATLLWGIHTLGSDLQLISVRRWAKLSLMCIGYLVLFEVVYHSTDIPRWRMHRHSELVNIMMQTLRASWWLVLVLGVAFYALALRSLIRLVRIFPRDDPEGPPRDEQFDATASPIGEPATNRL